MEGIIQAYFSLKNQPNSEQAVEQVVAQTATHTLKHGFLHLVTALQDWLICEDGSKRAQGTWLLADVVKSSAASLSRGDAHHVAGFLAARLSDWPCTEHAATACTALLQSYKSSPTPSTAAQSNTSEETDALLILRAAATAMAPQLQALAQPARAAGLRLLLVAIQEWGPAGLRASQSAGGEAFGELNFVEAAIAAVDGEKDPRCLLACFQLLRAAVQVYHAPGVKPAQLSAQAEEVVEVLSCYFPVAFTPPKNDPFKITRADLAQGLEACMSASPFLARWVMPLVLEKLSSTYRPAKEDALSALATCCCSFGTDALQSHLPAVWSALRNEIVIAPSAFGVVGGEELQTKRAIATRAAASLHTIMAHAPAVAAEFQNLALQDACVVDLLSLIETSNDSSSSAGGQKGSDPDRPDRIVLCTAHLLGTVCGGGVSACKHVLSTFMPRVLALLPPTPENTSSPPSHAWASTKVLYCLAVLWGVLAGITDGFAFSNEPPASTSDANGPSATSQQPLDKQQQQLCAEYAAALHQSGTVAAVVGALTSALQGVEPVCLSKAMETDEAEGHDTTTTAPQVLLACLAAWQALLSLHAATTPSLKVQAQTDAQPTASVLSNSQLAECVRVVMQWVFVAVGDGDSEEGLPAGVVTTVPARMGWRESQVAHLQALAVVQQALKAIDAQQGVSGSKAGEESNDSAGPVHAHLVQQMCEALLGQEASVLRATDATAQHSSSSTTSAQQPPSPTHVRARTLHAASALSSSSMPLALSLQSALLPLLLQLLRQQAQRVQEQKAGHEAWAPVTQELLLLLGTHLPPAWPHPLPSSHTHALSAFINTLLELPLRSAILDPAAAPPSHDTHNNTPTAQSQCTAAMGRALNSTCACCARLTACCTPEDQVGLAMTACEAVLLAAQQDMSSLSLTAADTAAAAQTDTLIRACAACSVVTGLQASVLAGADSVLQLVDALSELSTRQPMGESRHPPSSLTATSPVLSIHTVSHELQCSAGISLASVVNKWPGGPEELESVASRVLGKWGLLTLSPAGADSRGDSTTWPALAWVVRALAMRGSARAASLSEHVVRCLTTSEQPSDTHEAMAVDGSEAQIAQQGQCSFSCAAAGAALFKTVLSSTGDAAWHHARTRVLWQQRTLASCMGALLSALSSTPRAVAASLASGVATGASSNTAAEQENAALSVPTHSALLLSLASVLGSVPLAMLRADAPLLVSPILSMLHDLPAASASCCAAESVESVSAFLSQVHSCLEGVLGVLEQLLLRDAQLRPLLEDQVEALMHGVALLTGYAGSPAVRESALRCAMLILELPYHLLHPHRIVVIKAVNKALDDDRRSVRFLAVKCRRCWVLK